MKITGSRPTPDLPEDPKKPADPKKDLPDSLPPIAQVPPVVKKLVFGEEEVLAALQGISSALGEKGLRGVEIHIYGSVALICAFPGTRRLTTDIDAVASSPVVLTVAEEVGKSLGLPEEWFNEDVVVFARPGLQFVEHRFPGCENLKVYGLAPESLFAMKCFAGRDLKDIKDMKFLADKLGIRTLKEAEAIFERYYPGEGMGEHPMISLLEHFDGRFE